MNYSVHKGITINVAEAGESVLLKELWLTAKRHEILSRYCFGLRTTKKDFERIQVEFKKASINYKLQREKEDYNFTPPNASKAMVSLILSRIESK